MEMARIESRRDDDASTEQTDAISCAYDTFLWGRILVVITLPHGFLADTDALTHVRPTQLEIYNKRDLEEFMTLFTDDCTLVDLPTVSSSP
jgi:hypothetical protein